MEKEIDMHTGKTWIRHNKEEVKIGFLAQCIEGLAELFDCDYLEMFHRMEKANLTEGYILKFYEAIHTESWENIMQELSDLLITREDA